MKENIILNKSFDFSVRIINLYRYLMNNSKEYVLSKQILRSGTSIGANVNEAIEAQSKKDFISKMGIALKETSETIYWLRLLHATKYITKKQFDSICADAYEIKRIISSIILSSKEKGGKRWKIILNSQFSILNSSPPLPRRSFRNLTGSASARRAGLLSPS